MNKNNFQITVSIPKRIYDALAEKARMYGISVSTYIKILIFNDLKSDEVYR